MRLRTRHLLGVAELEPAEIALILDTAESFAEIGTREIKKVPTLRGRTVVNFFVEPSTRTRASFELAEKRLSADALNFSSDSNSSVILNTSFTCAMEILIFPPSISVMSLANLFKLIMLPPISHIFLSLIESYFQ